MQCPHRPRPTPCGGALVKGGGVGNWGEGGWVARGRRHFGRALYGKGKEMHLKENSPDKGLGRLPRCETDSPIIQSLLPLGITSGTRPDSQGRPCSLPSRWLHGRLAGVACTRLLLCVRETMAVVLAWTRWGDESSQL